VSRHVQSTAGSVKIIALPGIYGESPPRNTSARVNPARDSVEHEGLFFHAESRWGGGPVGPSLPPFPLARPAPT